MDWFRLDGFSDCFLFAFVSFRRESIAEEQDAEADAERQVAEPESGGHQQPASAQELSSTRLRTTASTVEASLQATRSCTFVAWGLCVPERVPLRNHLSHSNQKHKYNSSRRQTHSHTQQIIFSNFFLYLFKRFRVYSQAIDGARGEKL